VLKSRAIPTLPSVFTPSEAGQGIRKCCVYEVCDSEKKPLTAGL